MAKVGMDVEAVRGIGKQLKAESGNINNLIGQIEKLIVRSQSEWQGKDAVQFKDWWDSQHKPRLKELMSAIDGLGQSALNNANEQDQVSNR